MKAELAHRRSGLVAALAASGVSGVAVYLNSYAVRHVHSSPTTYTTAKNLVAALILAVVVLSRSRARPRRGVKPSLGKAMGLVYVGILSGGVAFALFFQGLAETSATTSAFIQKSLVIWVIAMAVPVLGEKVGPAQWAAVVLLVTGAIALGTGSGGVRYGKGPVLVLAATLLWAVEVIVVKHLLAWIPPLTLGLARMGIGTLALLAWLGATGRLFELGRLDVSGWEWVLLTGAVLAVYVSAWLTALARARAVDVAALLVSAAFVTAALSATTQGRSLPHAWGLILISAGTLVVAAAWRRSEPPLIGARQQ